MGHSLFSVYKAFDRKPNLGDLIENYALTSKKLFALCSTYKKVSTLKEEVSIQKMVYTKPINCQKIVYIDNINFDSGNHI